MKTQVNIEELTKLNAAQETKTNQNQNQNQNQKSNAMKTYLMPIYNTQKSFGNKAVVETENSIITLYSYNKKVSEINTETKTARVFDTYSSTTLRHIKDFLFQYGFEIGNKQFIINKYKLINKVSLIREPSEFKTTQIKSAKTAYEVIKKLYNSTIDLYEEFYVTMLDGGNNIISYAKIGQGGRSSTVVDVTILAKYALDTLASGVIISHNHPSGNMSASQSDIELTKKIKQALKLFEITLLDHIIISPKDNEYYSFADAGII